MRDHMICNISCDPSLELSWRDGSNEGSHDMLLWRNSENYSCDPFLSGALAICTLCFQNFTVKILRIGACKK